MSLIEEQGYTAFPEPVISNPLLDKFYHERYTASQLKFFLRWTDLNTINQKLLELGHKPIQVKAIYNNKP